MSFSESQCEDMSNPLLPRQAADMVNSPKGIERAVRYQPKSVSTQGILNQLYTYVYKHKIYENYNYSM